jgi:YD repeat-containing protein
MKSSMCSLRTLRSLMFICGIAALLLPLVPSQKSDARLKQAETATSDIQFNSATVNFVAAPLMLLPPACTLQTGLIISEFRFRGAAGPNDEFVELYNATDGAITVCTTDGSAGWAVAARNAAATAATTLFVIPNGTVIPGRGHYLGVNNSASGYSLGSYPSGVGTTATGDATYTIDVEDNSGVALFNTAIPASFSTSTRLDAIGFSGPTGVIADLYREGAGYPAIGTTNGQYTLMRRLAGGLPADANDNASDLWFLSTTAGTFGGTVGSSLGAPGPENLGSPVVRNSVLPMFVLDSTAATSVAPNRVRDLTSDPANNSTLGTMAMRRRIVNTSGASVTRLRFYVTTITTYPPPNGSTADLRVRSAGATTVSNVNDAATCAAGGTPSTPPCTVTVQGTTLEEPPTQSMGGGTNSTITVALAQPLAAGASVNVQFLVGVQQSGGFTFLMNCMGLPASNPPAAPSNLTVTTASNSQIDLAWTDNSSDETGFKIERKTGAAGTYSQIVTVGPNVSSYSNTGLSSNTQYYYRVRATNASGDSAYSNEANANSANLLPSVNLTTPANNDVVAAPANISLTATASDPDGTISKVQFYQGATLLGEDLSAPYSFTWNNIPAGSYSLTAKATDNAGAIVTSAAAAIVVNALPTVSITSPTHPTTLTAPANFTINASASDPDGSITKVQFFAGAALLGEDTTAPYSLAMNNLGQGVYSLTARAIDNRGATTTSSLVSVVVNTPPTVSITSPTHPTTLTAPANFTINASASDPDGSIAKVEFFAGVALLGTDTTAPFSLAMNNLGQGVYSLTAKATDNLGATATSTLVSVVVNTLPTVSITSPIHPTTLTAPATFTISASASDPDGSIAKVEFFAGVALLGTDTTAPFSLAMNNLGQGVYSLTAKATDNLGGTATSTLVSVVVNTLPSVSITSPVNSITLVAPANLIISASASDPDGSINKVEFFTGAQLLGTDTTPPHSFTWNNVGRGSYVLTAKATDNVGGTKTSTAVSVIVTDAPTTSITSPGNNAGFLAGSQVNINALASDDGSVAKVEFFQNGILLGQDTTAPYSFAWTNVPAGTYALTTRATDDLGVTANSAAVNINVIATNGVARLDPLNRTGGGDEDPLSRNYNWSAPLLSLQGRAGLDLGLAISYNSLVWTRNGNFITFDDDAGYPGPGFRLGFPVIQAQYFNAEAARNAYLLITSDGGRVELRQVGASALYEAADSSHLLLDSSTMSLRTAEGTLLQYVWKGSDFQCTQIKDTNGNFLTINYTGFGRIDTIVDTLARAIKFNYNPDNTLASISQTWTGQADPHVWASFTYSTPEIRTNFVNVTNVGPANFSTFRALRAVQLNDGSQYVFDYTSWGQVWKISNYAADAHLLNYRAYNLPLNNTTALDDCPRFTERRDWAENWNRGGAAGPSGLPAGPEEEVLSVSLTVPASASWTTPDGTSQTGLVAQITAADGTYVKNYFAGQAGTATGWQRGLASLTETFARSKPSDPITKQKSVVNKWTQDVTTVSYILNPRLEETNIYDHNASGQVISRARTQLTYQIVDLGNGMSCRLPSNLYEYQANANTVLRRTHTDYNLDAAYISRRILGLVSEKAVYETNPQTLAETLVSRVGFAYDEAGSIQGNDAPVQHEAGYNSGFVSGRGNLSSVKRHDVVNAGQFTLSITRFNTAGSAIVVIDPLSRQRSIGYADSYSDGNNGRNTLAYVTSITDPDGFTMSATYNFNFGSLTRTQAPPPAGQTAGALRNFTYDSKARLQKVALEFGANADYSHTRFEYPASQNRLDTYATLQNGAGEAHSFNITDGLGRVFATATDHPGSSGGFSGQLLLFDSMSRVIKSSNPTETSASGAPTDWAATGDDAPAGWLYTQQTYDWKGRPLVTTNPDLTTREASYSSCGCAGGDTVTLTDEGTIDSGVAKRRQLRMYRDILGRAVKTETLNWENGSVYTTSVTTYNALDQITLMREYAGIEGSATFQDKTITYDGYGRVKTQHLPEYGPGLTTTYNYNDDDTVQSVMDPRGTTATLTYNNRQLPIGIVYGVPASSNIPVTAPVTFGYDAAGNRSSMTDGSGSVSYQYNQLSRMTSETRTFSDASNASINNVSRTITYDYNLAGEISTVADGFGSVLTYGFDVTGRLNNLSGTGYAVSQFVTNMQYRAWNTLKSQTNGNGYVESATYNSRLLMTGFEVRSSSNQVSMSSTNQYYNDGHLKFSNALDERFDRAFSYDHLGRIKEGYSGSEARDFINGTSGSTPSGPYRQSFQYDAFDQVTNQIDRLWSQAETTISSYANNRRAGWSYDEAGRLLGDDTTTYTRDASGRITHKAGAGVSNAIKYDGNGQPIQQTAIRPVMNHLTTTRTYFLRATPMNSAVIADLNVSGNKTKGYVYAGKRPIAESLSTFVNWIHENPVTGSKGQSGSSGVFGATEELNAAGVNVGLSEPEPLEPSGFEIPEPTLRGMDLFGGSGCSIANPNCTTCYLDGFEHNCGHVMALAEAGALQIAVRNDRGDVRYVDVEVILGVLHVPGHTEHTHEERPGGDLPVDPNNPDGPWAWSPDGTTLITTINYIQGAFISLPNQPLFGLAFQQNVSFTGDKLKNVDDALALAKKMTDATRGKDAKKCDEALNTVSGGKIPSLNALVNQYVASGAGQNIYDGRKISIGNYGTDSPTVPAFVTGTGTANANTYLNSKFFDFTGLGSETARAVVLLHEAVHHFGGLRDVNFDPSKKPNQSKGSHNITNAIIDNCYPALRILFKDLNL